MGIKIEIDTERMALPEWQALAAFVAVMTKPEACDVKVVPGLDTMRSYITGENSSMHMPPAGTENDRRAVPVAVHVEHTVSSDLAAFGGAILSPADNPASGIDAELASFGKPDAYLEGIGNRGNAPGGMATAAPFVADPAAGAAPSVPPATPPVPSVPATAAAPQGSLVPLDKNGLPWDSRIHASTKTQNADATWRNKRGVSDEEIARVTAELRQVMAIPGPAAAVPAPPAPSVPGAPPPPPGVPAAPVGPMTFIKLMPKVTAALTSGQITKEHVDAVLQRFGFPHLPALAPRADLVPQVHDAIFGAA